MTPAQTISSDRAHNRGGQSAICPHSGRLYAQSRERMPQHKNLRMDLQLKGKNAPILGGARGIGRLAPERR